MHLLRSPRGPRESATSKDSTRHQCPVQGRSALTDPTLGTPRMWRGTGPSGGYDYWLARRSVGPYRAVYKPAPRGFILA